MTSDQDGGGAAYALVVSESERRRYRRMAEMARQAEAALWERAGIGAGARVADVGCGPGAMLRVLAELVGPEGEAHGVEPDGTAREAAAEEIGDLPHAAVHDGHGEDTGLEPGRYDAVVMRHVLFHTGDRAGAIVRHVAGLLRPGGWCYLVDTDLDGFRMAPPDADVMDEHLRYVDFQRARGNDVRIGTRLGHLLAGAGLTDIHREARYACLPGPTMVAGGPATAARPEMVRAGVATLEDGERWDAARARLSSATDTVFFIPAFIALGLRA